MQITNLQIATFAEGPQKCNKFCKSTNLRICNLWTAHLCKLAIGINNTSGTSGKVNAVVVDTISKFSTGVADTSGKFPTVVVDTGGVP